ncbi:hypothetical protein B7486_74760, partial [cyanobacterium TDX16]
MAQHARRQVELASADVHVGERAAAGDEVLERHQQVCGLLDPALVESQAGEVGDRAVAVRLHRRLGRPEGVEQLLLGLLPASGEPQDRAVGHPAVREHHDRAGRHGLVDGAHERGPLL